MKYLYCLLIISFAIPAIAQPRKSGKRAKEDKIANMIATLPDIIKADAYCQKKSHGKRHLETYVEDGPGSEGNFYWVKVVEDNGGAYHTWYNFKVVPKTYKIFYVDDVGGKDIPLEVWRKQKDYLGLD